MKMTEQKTLEQEVETLALENSFLKTKNRDLAKGLSDKAMKYIELERYIELLNEKLNTTEEQLSRHKEGFKRIISYSKSISVYLAKIFEEFTYCFGQCGTTENFMHLVPSDGQSNNKTRAVKPMVSGHTIRRPTIKLPRVSTEQLVQMNAGSSCVTSGDSQLENIEDEAQHNFLYSRKENGGEFMEVDGVAPESEVEEEEDDDDDDEEATEERNEIRLETLHEESEEEDCEDTAVNVTNQISLKPGKLVNGEVDITLTKRISTPSQTGDASTDMNSTRQNSKLAPPNNTTGGHKRNVENSNLDMSTALTNISLMENSLTNISTAVQLNGVAYQDIFDESNKAEDTTNKANSYDPLEGPSTLLDPADSQELSMSMFRVHPATITDKTSTPYAGVQKRKCIPNDVDKENLSTTLKRHVTQRKNANKPFSSNSQVMSECQVVLCRLSSTRFSEHHNKMMEKQSVSIKQETNTVCSKEDRTIPQMVRPQRKTKPLTSLKEPPLNKKMRR